MNRYQPLLLLALAASGTGGAGARPADAAGGTSTADASAGPSLEDSLLAEHNRVRRAEAAGLPPLRWSPELARFAQDWADRLRRDRACGMRHRDGAERLLSGRVTGENLFQGSSSRPYRGYLWSARDVVGAWASEKAFYDRERQRCEAGQACGHYTQMIWKTTTHVGCGRAGCGDSEVWVCNYLPAGNIVGRPPY